MMNDWQSNYSPSAASTFGPWYPTTTKIIKTQHTQTLFIGSSNTDCKRNKQCRTSIPRRRAISVSRRLPTAPTVEAKREKTLPEIQLKTLFQEPLYQRGNKMVQQVLRKLQYYRYNERNLIS